MGGGGDVHGGADEIPTDVTPGVPVPIDSGYQVRALRVDACGRGSVCRISSLKAKNGPEVHSIQRLSPSYSMVL